MKQNKKIIILSVSTIFVVCFFFGIIFKTWASDCEDQCKAAYPIDQSLQDNCEKNCKNLDKKAQMYENLLELNDKQQNTLSNQLEYINQQQTQNQNTLNETNSELEKLSQKIDNLERDIKQKEEDIKYERKMLSGLMQSYYDYDQQGILEIVLLNKTLINPFKQTDYIEQSGIKVKDVLNDIKLAQKELLEKQNELKNSYDQSSNLKEKLQDEKENLALSENQKQSLLVKTQNEEKKYQDLLARVEEQKKELFDFSSASNLTEVSDSVKDYPKPDSKYQASTSWYFSQKDSRWGNQRIGNSRSLMKDYGCAVTSVAMVFRKMGSTIDPRKLAKEKIFYYDLIKWPSSWTPGISLASSISHGNISWSKIDSVIKKGNPVIVYIKKTNGRGGHYVVVTGKDSKDYIVHDPYFGSNLYLGTSKALVGKIGTDSKVIIDQMIIYN